VVVDATIKLKALLAVSTPGEDMTKKPAIDRAFCMHCGACVGACPENALTLQEVWIEFLPNCSNCGICARACPSGAIFMEGSK
jgi:L-aspartate semialdehyde sulfurtransferase ferredoxin